MSKVISVSPFRCRMWVEHDRLQDHITEESCKAEIESFLKHGQLLPVLGRPIVEDPAFEVELIFGARRLFIARHLNVPLLVELRELADQDAIIALDIENRQRKNLSPYERALSYSNWLRAGYFSSQEEIARALRISPSQISRLLKLARLPSVVVEAFGSPVDLCEGWGLELYEVWQNPESRPVIAAMARAIRRESPRPEASRVFERLMSRPGRTRKAKSRVLDEVVKDDSGMPLFRVRYHRRDVALILSLRIVGHEALEKIKALVASELQEKTSQDVVSGRIRAPGRSAPTTAAEHRAASTFPT